MSDSGENKIKVSIITVVYNSVDTLQTCIDSVRAQTYPAIEHIVIDGGSTDGTVDLIKQNASSLAYWISERDRGIYDAMNKGLKKASGDIVGFLNADDFLFNKDAISMIAGQFAATDCACCYGDLEYVRWNSIDTVVRRWKSGIIKKSRMKSGRFPPHPTFYARKDAYKLVGEYRTELSLAADFDMMTRFIVVHEMRVSYIPEVLVRMRYGGASTRSVFSILRSLRECRRSLRLNKVWAPWFLPGTLLFRLMQLFR
jgi:glycosyltransferase